MAASNRSATSQFGARVRKQRVALGLSQEQLAEKVGLHFTYIGQIERGERNLGLINILRIAQGLGTDPGELLKGLRPGK